MQYEPAPTIVSRRKLSIGAIVAIVIATGVVVTGVATRRTADAELKNWTEDQAIPTVAIATPDTRSRVGAITLPGRLDAYQQAQIFARVSGYVKSWNFDIGAPVKAGDVLAEIDAPDLDQQIMQAQADLANAQANDALSKLTLQRGQKLIPSGAISKEVLDQRAADFASKEAILKSSQANLDRLRVLAKYKSLVAPFAGIVSARTTDVGALINAGSSAGGALYVISDVNRLRVYVNVPQIYVPSVAMGTRAKIFVPEYPGKAFPATVEASTRTVDAASGTTRMQLVVDNTKGELMAGAYATVSLDLAHPDGRVNIPASAVIFDQNGVSVATVDGDDRVVIKKVAISRDLGRVIEVASGVTPTDRIIVTPPDGIANGDRVRVTQTAPARVATTGAAAKDPRI